MFKVSQKRSVNHAQGITVTELVVVCFIILLLVAILIPRVQQSRTDVRRSTCKNNLKQMGLALHIYHDVYNTFPPGWIGVKDGASAAAGENGKTLFYFLQPFMEAGPAFDEMERVMKFSSHASQIIQSKKFQQAGFYCLKSTDPLVVSVKTESGSNLEVLKTNYAGVFGSDLSDHSGKDTLLQYYTATTPELGQLQGNGFFGLNTSVDFKEVTDGTSHTMMVGEIVAQELIKPGDTFSSEQFSGAWLAYLPQSTFPAARFLRSTDTPINSKNSLSFGSPHTGGTQFCLGDGAVRFIQEKIDPQLFKALGGINDGVDTSKDHDQY